MSARTRSTTSAMERGLAHAPRGARAARACASGRAASSRHGLSVFRVVLDWIRTGPTASIGSWFGADEIHVSLWLVLLGNVVTQ